MFFLKKIYRYFKSPRMIWGYKNPDGTMLKDVRISDSCFIGSPGKLFMGENVYIGHFNYIDASNGILIEEGCQITDFISIISHSSHISLRLYGREYIHSVNPAGYIKGEIKIGRYTFIGPHSVIMPGTILGKGTLVAAYSYVEGVFPDYAVLKGNPAVVVGNTQKIDEKYLSEDPSLRDNYNSWTDNKK